MIFAGADLYAILQVAPDAEREVIDAAYRQLMRKYHPDMARGDAALAAHLHERAKVINQAYAVLRDPLQRKVYDQSRLRGQPGSPPQPPPPRGNASPPRPGASPRRASTSAAPRTTWTPPPTPPGSWAQSAPTARDKPHAGSQAAEFEEPRGWWVVDAPLGMLASAYYLLPGPYEWDPASKREQLFTWLVPPLGVITWMATTGRLTPVLGTSAYSVLMVWALVAIALLIADWRSMPRFAVAGGLSLLLASGLIEAQLVGAGVPIWLVWLAIGGLGVLLAARAFFFGLLPTMGVCWLLSRID